MESPSIRSWTTSAAPTAATSSGCPFSRAETFSRKSGAQVSSSSRTTAYRHPSSRAFAKPGLTAASRPDEVSLSIRTILARASCGRASIALLTGSGSPASLTTMCAMSAYVCRETASRALARNMGRLCVLVMTAMVGCIRILSCRFPHSVTVTRKDGRRAPPGRRWSSSRFGRRTAPSRVLLLVSEAMNGTVLVTGAGGYIGRHVVLALLERGVHVKALDLRLDGVDPRAERVAADLFSADPEIYDRLGRPDVVLHMAWRDGFKHNSPAHLDDLPAHFHLIENLLAGGLKHLAVMGTMHEVGYWEGPIDETSPCRPASLYGISKNALRETAALLAGQHDALLQWIRAYYIVGDDKFGNSIFSKLLAAAEEGRRTFPFTSGKNKYDFISVSDLARQIAAIVCQDEVAGIVNACSGEPLSLADRVEAYIREHGLDLELEYGAFPDRPYDSPGVWGDATKIRAIMAAAR